MRNKIIAAALAPVAVAACTEISQYSDMAVAQVCAQPEGARAIERDQLSKTGLWVKCVPPGSPYQAFELVPKGATP